MKQTRFLMIIALVILLALTGCTGTPSPSKQPSTSNNYGNYTLTFKMMTGTVGGVWYPTGGAIAKLLEKKIPGLKVTVVPGAGVSNVQGIENGSSQLNFSKTATTYEGLQGTGLFKQKCDKVRNIAYLYDEAFQLVVPDNSGITKVEDIKGKSLTTLQIGNTGEEMMRDVLEVYGMSYKDFPKVSHVNYDDSVDQMKNGQALVWGFGSALPTSAVMDLATAKKLRILPIPDDKFEQLHSKNSGYIRRSIPKSTYDFLSEDVPTFGTACHLIVSADMPDQLAYDITKALCEGLKEWGSAHSVYKDLTPQLMAKDIGVPFHPGAIKYYKEIGVMK